MLQRGPFRFRRWGGQRVTLTRGVLERMPNTVATCGSTPEISSHAKALPAPFEWERNPDRPHPVWRRAIAFLLFARMIIETALTRINNRKFDANARRSRIFTSEFGDIEFRLIEALQRNFGSDIGENVIRARGFALGPPRAGRPHPVRAPPPRDLGMAAALPAAYCRRARSARPQGALRAFEG